jgi:nucleotide-binding universal stress UspA family protein
MADTNLSIHKILCPTDFSDFAASAFGESVRLARWFGAKVTVLHVLPFAVPIAGDMGYIPMSVANDKTVREAKLMEIQSFVDATEHTGVPIGGRDDRGVPPVLLRRPPRDRLQVATVHCGI